MGLFRAAERDLDQMADAIAGRQLHQAEPVAMGIETHGFGVDGHRGAEIEAFRQIALMQMNGQDAPPLASRGFGVSRRC
jgi:hypothetical protein